MQAERRLAIMQPYFFPYIGYFQLMAKVDAFVVFDDVNFINKGWINRNRINVGGAAHMVTVPLQQASQNRLICEIELDVTSNWRDKMLKTIEQSYVRAPQFQKVFPLIERIVRHPATNLADYLLHSLTVLRDALHLPTALIATSRGYGNDALKGQERIIDICLKERTRVYVNAIGGMELYARSEFADKGLELKFLQPTLAPYACGKLAHVPGLSIIDVLMWNDPAIVDDMLHSATLS
ncbi:WbqC family protein [Trinickia sp.]|uniref:WbqC family protein n=1 Tax=Trinickia sp. TaxID=2571163 RepID=UPI003F7F62B4